MNIRGNNDNIKIWPCKLNKDTSTQKFKKGGRPKLRPEQRLMAKRREAVTEEEWPYTKLRLPKTRYNSYAKINSKGDRSE